MLQTRAYNTRATPGLMDKLFVVGRDAITQLAKIKPFHPLTPANVTMLGCKMSFITNQDLSKLGYSFAGACFTGCKLISRAFHLRLATIDKCHCTFISLTLALAAGNLVKQLKKRVYIYKIKYESRLLVKD